MKWIILLTLISVGCTIKVEPIPKKKAVVVRHVHHYHHKGKPKPAATPVGESLQSKRFPIPSEPQDKLIGQPEPEPTP